MARLPPVLMALVVALFAGPALAQQEQPPAQQELPAQGGPDYPAPSGEEGTEPRAEGEDRGAAQQDGHALSAGGDAYSPPEILSDLEQIPFPARKMRELLLEAARAGDVEKLRPYIGEGDDRTMLSFGGLEDDPVDFLKSISGDGEGHEILAILQEVLEADFVRLDAGTENEMYVWPYFHAMPLDKLDPAQRVELYTLVTHGDYEEMLSFGAYNFYRAGISPQGRWRFFVAGD